jgi:hypothetical protein
MPMKLIPGVLVAALTAVFVFAGPALAQTELAPQDQAHADQYTCNHGAPDDPRTIDACGRLRSGESSSSAPAQEPSSAPSSGGAYPYPTPRYTPPHYTPPADQDEVAANAVLATKAAKVGQSGASNTVVEAKKAAPPPTDVGEAPVNADEQANETAEASADENNTSVSFSPHWLAGLGAFAIGLIILGSLIILPLHFLPTILAIVGHKRNTIWIFCVNLFFGWTVIGWIVALVWALSSDREL